MTQSKMTIREAARVAGVSPSTVQNWRSGGRPSGDFDTVRRLASQLGVSLCYLLTGVEDEPRGGPAGFRDAAGPLRTWHGVYEVYVKEIERLD